MTAITLQRSKHRASPRRESNGGALANRLLALQEMEIDFIPNPSFSTAGRENAGVVDATLQQSGDLSPSLAGLPAHLRRMCESDLLTHEQEMALFREMNYLKYQASELRGQLHLDQDDLQAALAIESLLAKAQTIRDYLVKANTRLVISIVKKYVTAQHSFDDLLSDGIFTLMKAVEKFDFDRGFRFSTYAYRSIARSVYQAVAHARQEEARFTRDAEEWAFEDVDKRSSFMSDQVWSGLRELTGLLMKQLDRRERFIIRSRYALGAHRKVRTFQYLADKLGVSKERVRQLEQRAVAKLQAISKEYEIDELSGTSMM